jgi:ABC-type nickel/cobalt efflux system permease component RcnA
MINREILVLIGTAATLGLVHTVLGPDHYLPFIVLSRARKWSLSKTLLISFFCGLGHVLSSVVLGFVGITLGIGVSRLASVESLRGGAAIWLLIGFGFAYFIWGMHRAIKNRPHKHIHIHADGEKHEHLHTHEVEHSHVHVEKKGANLTPWILFVIFVFGPCEPLIPLVMFPAMKQNISGLILVTIAFGLTTIITMLTIIAVSSWGIKFIRLGRLERYAHAIAGAMILISGLSVLFLGL